MVAGVVLILGNSKTVDIKVGTAMAQKSKPLGLLAATSTAADLHCIRVNKVLFPGSCWFILEGNHACLGCWLKAAAHAWVVHLMRKLGAGLVFSAGHWISACSAGRLQTQYVPP